MANSKKTQAKVATQTHTVTEQDLIDNPELTEKGVQVGDVIEVPVADVPVDQVVDPAQAQTVDQAVPEGETKDAQAPVEPSNTPAGDVTKQDDDSSEANYTMLRRVKWNDILFEVGQKVSATEQCAQLFLANGYMK